MAILFKFIKFSLNLSLERHSSDVNTYLERSISEGARLFHIWGHLFDFGCIKLDIAILLHYFAV